jgi:excisionase family DNA binding protein
MKSTRPSLTWENAPDILTVEEASVLVRVPRNGVYGVIRAGLLPAVRLGPRRIRIAKAALREVFGSTSKQTDATAALNHGKA